jgi:SAM-dependent methyltransferase
MELFDDATIALPTQPAAARRAGVLARRRLRVISRLLARAPSEIALLDVGCSSGAFLLVARSLGYRCSGVEPARRAAEGAAAAGLDVFAGVLEEAHFPSGSFDAITTFEVIEHLKEPLRLLEECRRILKPGGVLMIGTGNAASWTVASQRADWDYFGISGHVSIFNTTSIRVIAERTGLEIERVRTSQVRFVARKKALTPVRALAKLAGEALSYPARWLGKGHDMLAVLRAPLRP